MACVVAIAVKRGRGGGGEGGRRRVMGGGLEEDSQQMRCGTTSSLISPETGWTPTENRVSSMLLPHIAFSYHHFPDQMLLLLLLFIVKRM